MSPSQVPSLKRPLDEQIGRIRGALANAFGKEIEGALLIGSCARGEATHRSDIDLLIFLKEGPLTFERTRSWRDRLDQALSDVKALNAPLPVQAFFLLPESWQTQEPAMSRNLDEGVLLYDVDGALHKRLRTRFPHKEPRAYDK